ncbi:MAG: small mechanosensitive ion channel, partial [Cyanobacteria bacterium P01_D01_bin.56]
MTETLWLKALTFVVGFPLITIILGELIDRLANRGYKPITKLLTNIRNLVVPSVAVWLLLHQFLATERNTITIKVIETAIGAAIIIVGLSLLEVLLTSEAKRSAYSVLQVPRLFLQIARISLVLCISF